ncbi:MAG TPA: integration host factor, actinobacterial type [Pseudonocardiaceae bacterium]|nr:integration host factor, actinobacterial type [Pseudonocardiaceae bacterium]
MALPNLTPEQRQAALAKAAEARQARTKLLNDIKAGKETIPTVLARAKEDAVVGKTKVAQLIRALPGYGPAKVTAILDEAGIPVERRAAGLGDRQRAALLTALG